MQHELIAAFVAERLGAPVAQWRFTSHRRATTWGARLEDGREVVVKLHPGDGPDAGRLAAVQEVQRHLAAAGFPCPRPLAPPSRVAGRVATVEALLDGGRPPDPASAADRRVMAHVLAEIVKRCTPFRGERRLDASGLGELPRGVLWPPPPAGAPPFGPARDAETREIDGIARRARRLRLRAREGPAVVGHGDWHVEHLRLAGGRAVAVYDWDALVRAPEPFLVGCAVGGFTANWAVDRPPVVPRYEEAVGFVAAYEEARGAPFPPAERAAVLGHWLELTAYAARVEHARDRGERRYRDALADHAGPVLGSAG